MQTAESIDGYIHNCPENIQLILQKLRSSLQALMPEAQEVISYGIPTFKLKGKNVVHYAAFKNHISLFPGASGVQAFEEQLTFYTTSKGTIQFPLNQPLPMELITTIVKFRIEETLAKTTKKK